MPDKRYTEDELKDIMRRATEKQRIARESSGTFGLSLDEVKRIAREVGIDPVYIEQAALDIGGGAEDVDEIPLVGGPHAYRYRRVVQGRFNSETMSKMAQIIRRHSKSDAGHVETYGNSLHWRTSSSNAVKRTVDVRELRDGRVEIEASSRLVDLAWVMQLATIFMAVISVFLFFGGDITPSFILGGISIASFLLMRFAFGLASDSSRKNLESMINELQSEFTSSGDESASGDSAVESQLELDQLDDDAYTNMEQPRRRDKIR